MGGRETDISREEVLGSLELALRPAACRLVGAVQASPRRVGVDRPAWLERGRITPMPERAPRVCAAYLKLVRATGRFEVGGLERTRREVGDRSCIVAILHRESLLHVAFPHDRRTAILVRDQASSGLYLRLARSFGLRLIEQTGPLPPVREALAFLANRGSALVIAVDGPAGPTGIAKRGVVELARLSGTPIVPIRCATRRVVTLRTTWDRRHMPLPGQVFVAVAGEPRDVPRDATRSDLDSAAGELSSALANLAP